MEIVTSWLAEGIKRGIQQGVRQRVHRGAREERLGDIPYEIDEMLQTVHDVTVLKKLIRLAAAAPSIAQLVEQLQSKAA